MQVPAKATYSPPHLAITEFEAADVMMLSVGTDENQADWQPTKTIASLPLDDLQIRLEGEGL
ncbi:MAG: hypothetical protein IJY20_03415 [Clostridia bacterium]|nr:hypothetical protein [Clostridia bacterium]